MWFKYGTTAKWIETYDENDYISQNVNNFVKYKTNRIIGESLRSQIFNKLISKRRVWEIVIAADEMATAAVKSFITAFFTSGSQTYINITDAASPAPTLNYIEVSVPAGDEPLEFINGHPDLPKFVINLEETDGDL
jgi:hypothetical protein